MLCWPRSAASPRKAQDAVEQFFRGKSINIYVGSSAGGGYDTYGRLVARHLGKHIPGQPTIVVQNMPGAGTNKAAGYIYTVAPKDGTAIGAIFPGAILQPLLGDTTVQHEPNKFIYLGSANSDVYHCFVRTDAPAKTFRDALDKRDDRRRQQRGRHHPRPAGDDEQSRRRKIPHRHRLCRHQGDRARGRAQRSARRVRHRLDRLHHALSALVRAEARDHDAAAAVKGHPDLNKMGVPLATEFARTKEDRRRWSWC